MSNLKSNIFMNISFLQHILAIRRNCVEAKRKWHVDDFILQPLFLLPVIEG